jgi:hypothetical protein
MHQSNVRGNQAHHTGQPAGLVEKTEIESFDGNYQVCRPRAKLTTTTSSDVQTWRESARKVELVQDSAAGASIDGKNQSSRRRTSKIQNESLVCDTF